MRAAPIVLTVALWLLNAAALPGAEEERPPFQPKDVFQLQYASEPRISPDGKKVVYVRNFMDVMKDRRRSNLWIVHVDGSRHEALTSGDHNDSSPRWSPDGKRLAFLSSRDGKPQLYCLWLETGRLGKLTHLTEAPREPAWSPDGKEIAFISHVPVKEKPFIEMPDRPEGATWAAPPRVIGDVVYRVDGRGYLRSGSAQLFVMPADGGAARQLTAPPLDLGAARPAWTPDGKALLVEAIRRPERDLDPRDTEVYRVPAGGGAARALTDRRGPDFSPVASPDGSRIAYLGFDDRRQGYQVTRLYVMNADGKERRLLSGELDADVAQPVWAKDGKGLFFQTDRHGDTKVAFIDLEGKVSVLAGHVGGLSLDRPYSGGSFSVSDDGTVACTLTRGDHPADVAVVSRARPKPRRLTRLNAGLLGQRGLGRVEEVWYKSSHDGLKIQGWVVKPPSFDPKKKYPLILEIHGGPFANYGERFAADVQLYAAKGYVVFYANPRGSTSYGEKFGNLIHHAYPGHDYDDLMSGVDAVLSRGYVDRDNLFVTGGSGGGVLTAWIVGKTHRFRAAVVAKPVINWYSFVLTADLYPFFVRNWFPGPPWEHAEHYLKRSPLSQVGKVKTPTLLLTGEEDRRTPISEAEQFYQALKLRKVDTLLVRIPGASHDIGARPSQLIAKAACVLAWFEKYRRKP